VTTTYKKVPNIAMSIYRAVKDPRVRLLFIVNADGSVENVQMMRSSANAEFDRLIVDAIKEWRFRAAVRKGKKVRCMVELPVVVQAQSGSPFTVN